MNVEENTLKSACGSNKNKKENDDEILNGYIFLLFFLLLNIWNVGILDDWSLSDANEITEDKNFILINDDDYP